MTEAFASHRPAWRRVLLGSLVIAYPVLVYFGLSHWDVRSVGVLMVGMLGTIALLRALDAKKEGARAILPLAPALVLAIAAALIREPRFLLFAPVLISLALLWAFGRTLRAGRMAMVERFARMQEATLPDGAPSYCRTVTKVWVAFFVLNAALAGALALFAPLEVWTLYTGFVAYLLIGAVFTVEYIVRKAKFRRYGRGPHDWLLARVFPPRQP